MARLGRPFIVTCAASFGLAAAAPAGAQQLAAQDFPAELRGQVEDTMRRSVLAPPVSPQATCGTVIVGQHANWSAPAPWKRVFSHHPSEWPWLRQYPSGTQLRLCQYTERVAGPGQDVAYTVEVATLNPTPARLMSWMASACKTAIQVSGASPARFDQCLRGLFWGLPTQAPEDKKARPGIRQVAGGNFVVAGAVVQERARGGVVCYRDGVAVLRERPGLPMTGYFALTEADDGGPVRVAKDGELGECFKIASPKEWPGGSPGQVTATTRDQLWAALPKLGRSPADFGLTARADIEPSETWRRVVREAHLAALKSDRNVLVDAWALANAQELLR
ncbi:MAG: hypothetical protein KIT25_17485 [Enhydrobacter sp.]|nr:MAG: hypothetical protein KIT25_17485 [Enhydrobacter sp.]